MFRGCFGVVAVRGSGPGAWRKLIKVPRRSHAILGKQFGRRAAVISIIPPLTD
jgi:hypothetical protein